MIALIDYGAGNLTSVRKALAALGAEVLTPAAPADLAGAEGIIVPGVGHFEATRALDRAWREAIRGALDRGVALFGICLGMQWLFEGSEEAPGLAGLGVFEGTCHRLTGESSQDLQVESPVVPGGTQKPRIGPTPFSTLLKIPHVGWNQLEMRRAGALLRGIEGQAQVYFTHSYVAPVTSVTAAVTSYGTPFAAAVEDGRIAGVQFHPEKSGDVGLRILRNWLEIANRRRSAAQGRPSTILQRAFPDGPRTDRLSKRIIACLDVRDGRVVKGINFEGLREAGDPGELAARYNRDGIDEIVILDVTATIEARQARAHTINAVAREIFLPLAVGGGIRSEDDAAAAIDAGADKVSLNTAALSEPGLITRLAARYGSQAVIVAIDAKRGRGRFEVYARSGTDQTTRDAVEWACEAANRGAGEILLTSIDRDGTKAGFDCELTAAVSRAVSIPVIASGGAGTFEHFAEVFTAGAADAALAASIFHFNERSVSTLKSFLAERHIPVRGSAIAHSSEVSG